MSALPIIGREYRPQRFEHRTPVEYRALRPAHSLDAERLQAAMLPAPRRWIGTDASDRVIGYACVAVILAMAVAWLAGVL